MPNGCLTKVLPSSYEEEVKRHESFNLHTQDQGHLKDWKMGKGVRGVEGFTSGMYSSVDIFTKYIYLSNDNERRFLIHQIEVKYPESPFVPK